jgi:N-acetylmuramoyl-L-alanine amidase
MTNEKFYRIVNVLLRIIAVLLVLLAVLTVANIVLAISDKNAEKAALKENTKTEQKLEIEEKTTEKETPWYTQEELDLMARLIYFEARGESYEGQVAVGAVVINRLHTKGFPNTIYDVIYQKNQFSPVASSKWESEIVDFGTCYQAAREALNGADPTGGALFFYNPEISTSEWIFTREVIKVIGNHAFAK